MLIQRFSDAVRDKDYSDLFVAQLYGQLVAKNISWKVENKTNKKNNPFRAVDNGATLIFIQNHRPNLYVTLAYPR
jgi:hypothetical protein